MTNQEIHDLLYTDEVPEINGMVLEENEVSEVFTEWSHDSKSVQSPEIASLSVIPPEVAEMSNRNSSNEEYVTAYEALKMQSDQEELDMRPYLLDGNSGQHILLDSGSQVCAWPPDAGDIPDPKMRLKAVNGSKLKCYGYKKVEVKIGRKTYDIEAVKTDVQKPILGWNFTRKHKLTTGWTTWGDMELSDPKAKIKQILKYRSVHDQTHRLSVLKKPENTQKSAEQMLFEMASVEALECDL